MNAIYRLFILRKYHSKKKAMHIKTRVTQGSLIILLVTVSQLNGCAVSSGNTSDRDNTTAPVSSASGIALACQAQVLRPAKLTPHREIIRVFEPAPEYKNTPATIEWGIKRIQVEPARLSNETIPAQYKEVTERVTVLRERTELKGIAAVYKTIERPVTVTPAHTLWKAGCVPEQDTAECFVEVPKKTRILKQQIIDIPAKIIQERLPAETVEVKKKVLIKPGQGNGTVLPPRYRDIKVGKIARVWQIAATKPHPRYETVQVQKQERPQHIKSAPAVCTDNTASPAQIKRIQQRLQQRGLPLTVNGEFDRQSWLALTKFQQDNDLFIGAVTAETLGKLGL